PQRIECRQSSGLRPLFAVVRSEARFQACRQELGVSAAPRAFAEDGAALVADDDLLRLDVDVVFPIHRQPSFEEDDLVFSNETYAGFPPLAAERSPWPVRRLSAATSITRFECRAAPTAARPTSPQRLH